MQGLQTVALILTPMFIGFLFRLPKRSVRMLDTLLGILVYLILLLIGMGLAQLGNLMQELGNIARYTVSLFVLLMLCNIAALVLFDRIAPLVRRQTLTPASAKGSGFSGSIKQIGVLLLGLLLGRILPEHWLPPESAGTYVLMALVFVVGIQLRSSGIPLKSVLLNKRGIVISVILILSCLLAGALFSLLFDDVSLGKGLALASGYGWYSLSGIMMTQAYGASWGSVALLNDLLRELFALMFIAALMPKSPSSAIGIGGATSMDFTLPVIQQSGGLAVVPVAISSGFIANLVSPLLMALFSGF